MSEPGLKLADTTRKALDREVVKMDPKDRARLSQALLRYRIHLLEQNNRAEADAVGRLEELI